jgi:hypothetical protein
VPTIVPQMLAEKKALSLRDPNVLLQHPNYCQNNQQKTPSFLQKKRGFAKGIL